MRILIIGGTGFIGRNLCRLLLEEQHEVIVCSRDSIKAGSFLPHNVAIIEKIDDHHYDFYDVIINLAGQPIDQKRWNRQFKSVIYDSRINTTQQVLDYIANAKIKPQALINASATGYYGSSRDVFFSERSEPIDHSFSHILCKEWEELAMRAENYGVRVCLLRFGFVLGANGGPLQKMLSPFKYGLGAIFAGGNEWMSWIHIEDAIGIISQAINDHEIVGPINVVAPNAVTNREFSDELATQLRRPRFMSLPASVVKLLFGEMGSEVLLTGQKVFPEKMLDKGYKFRFTELDQALEKLLMRI